MKSRIIRVLTVAMMITLSSVMITSAATETRFNDGKVRRISENNLPVLWSVPKAMVRSDEIVLQEGVRYALDGTQASVVGYTKDIDENWEIPGVITVDGDDYSVTSIAGSGLLNCSNLVTVTIPDSIEEIGSFAFSGCDNLIEISISASVCDLGDQIFKNCKSLQNIVVADDNLDYYSIDGVLFDADGVLLQYPCFSELYCYDVPEGTTAIGAYAFYEADMLEEVTLPDSILSIGKYAFDSCYNLTQIDLGEGLENIDFNAFWDCSSLQSVYLPSTVTSLDGAFGYMSSMEAYIVEEGNPVYFSQDGVLFQYDDKESILVYYPAGNESTRYVVPQGVNCISETAFSDAHYLEEIILPDGLRVIEWDAFSNSAISSIVIPDSVIELAAGAFWNCWNLETVTLGSGISSIEAETFIYCDALENIHIPKQLKNIDSTAFIGCSSLEEFSVAEENSSYSAVDGVLYSKDKTKLIKYPEGKKNTSYEIISSVTMIEAGSIYNKYLKNLSVASDNTIFYVEDGVLFERNGAEVTLHTYLQSKEDPSYIVKDNIDAIANYAFFQHEYLRYIDLGKVMTIGRSAFEGSSLEDVILNSVESIEHFAFFGSTLTSIVFPSTIDSLGNQVIDYCDNLEYVVFKGSVPGSIDSLSEYGNEQVRYIYVPAGMQVEYKEALADKCNAGAMIVEGDYVSELTVQDKVNSLSERSTVQEINDAVTGLVRLTTQDVANISDDDLVKADRLFQNAHSGLNVTIFDEQAGTKVDIQGAAMASGLVEYQSESGEVSGNVEIIVEEQDSWYENDLLTLDFTMYVNDSKKALQAPVLVSVQIPDVWSSADFELIHRNDDWEEESIEYTLDGNMCTFRASSFSSYIFRAADITDSWHIYYDVDDIAYLYLVSYEESGRMKEIVECWEVSGSGSKNYHPDEGLTYQVFLLDANGIPVGYVEME